MLRDVYRDFLDSHEQACRRTLYRARDAGSTFADLSEEEKGQINHAVAQMNLIGYLWEEKLISREDAINLMGSTAERVDFAAQTIGYYEYRKQLTGKVPWRYLRKFASEHRGRGVSEAY